MQQQGRGITSAIQKLCERIACDPKIKDGNLPQLLTDEYKAEVYLECDTVKDLEVFCFSLLKLLGCPYAFNQPRMRLAMQDLKVIPPAGCIARDVFTDFCYALPAMKTTVFYWFWKNFCCWMYEVVHAWTSATPPRYIFAFLKGRIQRDDAGNEQHIVPHAVVCTANRNLGMTTLCDFCSQQQQRKGCTEVQLTYDVQGELSIIQSTMHHQCYTFLACWTNIHRLSERTAEASKACPNDAFNDLEFFDSTILPWMATMHGWLTTEPRKKRKRETISAREQQVSTCFQCDR